MLTRRVLGTFRVRSIVIILQVETIFNVHDADDVEDAEALHDEVLERDYAELEEHYDVLEGDNEALVRQVEVLRGLF